MNTHFLFKKSICLLLSVCMCVVFGTGNHSVFKASVLQPVEKEAAVSTLSPPVDGIPVLASQKNKGTINAVKQSMFSRMLDQSGSGEVMAFAVMIVLIGLLATLYTHNYAFLVVSVIPLAASLSLLSNAGLKSHRTSESGISRRSFLGLALASAASLAILSACGGPKETKPLDELPEDVLAIIDRIIQNTFDIEDEYTFLVQYYRGAGILFPPTLKQYDDIAADLADVRRGFLIEAAKNGAIPLLQRLDADNIDFHFQVFPYDFAQDAAAMTISRNMTTTTDDYFIRPYAEGEEILELVILNRDRIMLLSQDLMSSDIDSIDVAISALFDELQHVLHDVSPHLQVWMKQQVIDLGLGVNESRRLFLTVRELLSKASQLWYDSRNGRIADWKNFLYFNMAIGGADAFERIAAHESPFTDEFVKEVVELIVTARRNDLCRFYQDTYFESLLMPEELQQGMIPFIQMRELRYLDTYLREMALVDVPDLSTFSINNVRLEGDIIHIETDLGSLTGDNTQNTYSFESVYDSQGFYGYRPLRDGIQLQVDRTGTFATPTHVLNVEKSRSMMHLDITPPPAGTQGALAIDLMIRGEKARMRRPVYSHEKSIIIDLDLIPNLDGIQKTEIIGILGFEALEGITIKGVHVITPDPQKSSRNQGDSFLTRLASLLLTRNRAPLTHIPWTSVPADAQDTSVSTLMTSA